MKAAWEHPPLSTGPAKQDFWKQVLWLGYKMPPKACVLKSWSPDSGSVEKRLDYADSNFLETLLMGHSDREHLSERPKLRWLLWFPSIGNLGLGEMEALGGRASVQGGKCCDLIQWFSKGPAYSSKNDNSTKRTKYMNSRAESTNSAVRN